jgi:hypothetical protein
VESVTERAVHPYLSGVQQIEASLEQMTAAGPASIDTATRRGLLLALARLESRLTAVRLEVMATSDDVASAEGARDVAALLTHHTRGDGAAHRRDLAFALSLNRRWPRVLRALRVGELNLAQAGVIARALDELPGDEVDLPTLERAEAYLVAAAATRGPAELRGIGRTVLEAVAPERFDHQEQTGLETEERRARRATSLTMKAQGDGTTWVHLVLPDAAAVRLRTYLEAFTSPRHEGRGEADRVPASRKLGQAFCSLLESVDPHRLPVHGGDATTVIVTVPLQVLREELAGSGVVGSERLSAAEARRLACTAEIVPAVLGGESEVLDLGRGSRLFRPAQRKAMVVRDRECRAHGCTVPATWCEAHHWGAPWARGGRTDLADGVLLCRWHHHRAHDPEYDASRMPNGDVRFRRR